MNTAEERDKLRKMRDDGTITEEQYERAVAELKEERDDGDDYEEERRPRRKRRRDDDDYEEELTPRERERKIREWAMFLHLSLLVGHFALLAGIIVPILMWQTKKDEWPKIDRHGKNAINWMISYYIYLAVSGVLCFVFVGFVLLPVVLVLGLVFPVIGAIRANEGKVWHYPLAIPFLN